MNINQIITALHQPLPGLRAQYLMAPGYRPEIPTEEVLLQNPKIGAVLILLVPRDGAWQVVFTQRLLYAGVHSGQMSFPGGKREATDTDLTHTALRETEEEIGIPAPRIHTIGSLTELYIPPSHFLIYPTVGYLDAPLPYIPQTNEVAEVVEIPLSFFLDPASRSSTIIRFNTRTDVTVPAYVYDRYTIWGATAIVMSELVYMLTEGAKSLKDENTRLH